MVLCRSLSKGNFNLNNELTSVGAGTVTGATTNKEDREHWFDVSRSLTWYGDIAQIIITDMQGDLIEFTRRGWWWWSDERRCWWLSHSMVFENGEMCYCHARIEKSAYIYSRSD